MFEIYIGCDGKEEKDEQEAKKNEVRNFHWFGLLDDTNPKVLPQVWLFKAMFNNGNR